MVLVMVFTGPAYILPVVLGVIMLIIYKDERGRMAAWFTLKPLLATPLWALALGLLDNSGVPEATGQVLSLAPAVLLTLWIAWRYRGVFRMGSNFPFVLIGADALRWLNTLAWMLTSGRPQLTNPFFLVGWILPNAYAILAFLMVRAHAGQGEEAVQEAN